MRPKLFTVFVLGALLFTACAPAASSAPTPDVVLARTSAAQTVVANFTLTAAVWTPTPLPPPANTPEPLATPALESTSTASTVATATTVPTLPGGTPGATAVQLCDSYSWDDNTVDVNVPDNTQMTPGQPFVKTWKIKNSGTCTWGAGYKIIFSYGSPPGEKMSGQPQPLAGPVQPGQEVEISVNFTAPTQVGTYVSSWTLQNAAGRPFFGSNIQGTMKAKPLYVKVIVK